MSGPVKDPLRALQGARSRAQGGRLEEQIEASCALLTETGRADISKTPEPMKPVSQPNKSGQFRAVYTKKAEPDFKGVMLGGRAVMFEAKSTGTGRLTKTAYYRSRSKSSILTQPSARTASSLPHSTGCGYTESRGRSGAA